MPGLAPAFAAVVAALVVAVPVGVRAASSALTVAQVRELVTRPDCGGVRDDTPEGVALRERMVAKFRQESGLRGTDLVHPFAIRDETEGVAVKPVPATYEAAVAEAMGRIARGHVLGLGLGQITGVKNLLADFGVDDVATAVRRAFVPCLAVRAAARHYAADVRHVLDRASRRYNTGSTERGENYARSVAALEAALPADLVRSRSLPMAASAPPVEPFPQAPFGVLVRRSVPGSSGASGGALRAFLNNGSK